MARAPKKLTDEWLANKPFATGTVIRIPVAALPGLHIDIGKRTKVFKLQAERPARHGAKRKTHVTTIGHAPQMKIAEALVRATEALQQIDRGQDPNRIKRSAPRVTTFAEAWAVYKASLKNKDRSPKTLDAFEYSFRLLKPLHDHSLAELSADPGIGREEHERITAGSGPIAANGALRLLRATFRHMARSDRTLIRDHHPATTIDWNPEVPAQTAMSTKDLLVWFSQLDEVREDNPVRAALHEFMLRTGLRKNDAITAQWKDLDVDERMLFIPCPKGGTKRSFWLPLNEQAFECLMESGEAGKVLYPLESKIWCFAADSKSGHVKDISEKRRDGSKRLSHVGHALRHTFATFARGAGVPEEVVAAIMNHMPKTQTASYVTNKSLTEFYREQMDRASKFIDYMRDQAEINDRLAHETQQGTLYLSKAQRKKLEDQRAARERKISQRIGRLPVITKPPTKT